MITKEDKKAIYGAIQRLLNKASMVYPYNSKDFDFEVGFCPDIFGFEIGLVPNIMTMGDDYSDVNPELGDSLLQKLIDSDIVGDSPMREKFFATDINFDEDNDED